MYDQLLRCYFLSSAGLFCSDLYAYTAQYSVNQMLLHSEDYLAQHELGDYTDEMLLYMMTNNTMQIDEAYDEWFAQNFRANAPQAPQKGARQRLINRQHTYPHLVPLPVFSVQASDWDDNIGYYYQAMHELGYFDLKWDYYYDTQAEADSVNALWQSQTINVLALGYHIFDDVEFNTDLMEFVRQSTAQTQSKMLFIYGNDDLWTGAHMDDDCVNGQNVRMYILPEQNHGAHIDGILNNQLRKEIWSFLDAIYLSEPESITAVRPDSDSSAPALYYDLYGRRLDPRSLHNQIVLKGRVR